MRTRSRRKLTVWGWAVVLPLGVTALIAVRIGGKGMDLLAGTTLGLMTVFLFVGLLASSTSLAGSRLGRLARRFLKAPS